ncbi:hypothetical protein PHYBOEH_001290 [Phytophthora boehmeriae]|uniref:Uncharacterized protein n=1 Tax=Phytophthora boehmeriae TaxID=109152 RepID=A0A8T1WUD2_9STRA|nr:hypothetical protein PHYBOEH_001290 [Phytophthora boehmeriae]
MDNLTPLPDQERSPMPKKTPKPGEETNSTVSPPVKSSRLPADVRRARHRDRMQRMRLAEKRSIEVKRVEVERLTRELENLIKKLSKELEERKSQGEGVEGFPLEDEVEREVEREGEVEWKAKNTAARLVQQRYLSLVLQQESITEENRRLTERFKEWQRFMKLLGVEHDRLPKYEDEGSLGSPDPLLQDSGEGRWVVFSDEEPVIFYQPIERPKCHELAFIHYQKMQEMLQGPGARKLHGEAFGWKVYFSFYEEAATEELKIRMQHRFTKRISSIADDGTRVTGDTLAGVTWNIINTPELYSQMYRSPMTSRIMQHVDAHTCVMMRTYPDENAEMKKRFVSLVVQVQDCVIDSTPGPMDWMGLPWSNVTRRRVTILSSILNPEMCLPRGSTDVPNPSMEWMREGFGYLSFTEIDDENVIEIEYGGSTNVGSETASCTGLPFVAMNMGEALVRWEQLVTTTRTLSITENS